MEIGAISPFLWAFEVREVIFEVLEELSGGRMHSNIINYYKLLYLNTNIKLKILSLSENGVNKNVYNIMYILNNRIWLNRSKNIGFIQSNINLNFSLTGIVARASGIKLDLRKFLSHNNIYSNIYFNIPFSNYNDIFNRFILKLEEIVESSSIIKNLVNDIHVRGYKICVVLLCTYVAIPGTHYCTLHTLFPPNK
jgi:NADH:ubiquinone oxidoreductase subunit D